MIQKNFVKKIKCRLLPYIGSLTYKHNEHVYFMVYVKICDITLIYFKFAFIKI